MRLLPVELLSNLAWLAVAFTLWGLWAAKLRGTRETSFLPRLGVPIMALVMLTAILLPVIAVTDDLHDCQLPAEVKRGVAQSDRQLFPAAPSGSLPFALAHLALCISSLRPGTVAFLAVEENAPRLTQGHLLSPWSRPPPAA